MQQWGATGRTEEIRIASMLEWNEQINNQHWFILLIFIKVIYIYVMVNVIYFIKKCYIVLLYSTII